MTPSRSAQDSAPRTIYFAYGSNLDPGQMARRCPDCQYVGTARAEGRQFLIMSRGYATIIPAEGRTVHGVVWTLTPEDETRLDHYEGVAKGSYYKATVAITLETGETCEAMTYIAAETRSGPPNAGYLECIVAAAEGHGLPADYVAELQRLLIPRLNLAPG